MQAPGRLGPVGAGCKMSDVGPFPQTTSAPRLPKAKLFPSIQPRPCPLPHSAAPADATSPSMAPPMPRKHPPFLGFGGSNAATSDSSRGENLAFGCTHTTLLRGEHSSGGGADLHQDGSHRSPWSVGIRPGWDSLGWGRGGAGRPGMGNRGRCKDLKGKGSRAKTPSAEPKTPIGKGT